MKASINGACSNVFGCLIFMLCSLQKEVNYLLLIPDSLSKRIVIGNVFASFKICLNPSKILWLVLLLKGTDQTFLEKISIALNREEKAYKIVHFNFYFSYHFNGWVKKEALSYSLSYWIILKSFKLNECAL